MGKDYGQVRMKDLLEDPVFAQWIERTPTLLSAWNPHPAWQVLFQTTELKWGRRIFEDYEEGLAHLMELVEDDDVHDVTLGCRREMTAPPLLKVKVKKRLPNGQLVPAIRRRRWANYPDDHVWCGYCRRPTVFVKGLAKHHAFTGHFSNGNLDPAERRCLVCGMRLTQIRHRWPTATQSSPSNPSRSSTMRGRRGRS